MKFAISSVIFVLTLFSCVFYACTKDVAKNPLLAYSDKALLDSARNTSAFTYYKNTVYKNS